MSVDVNETGSLAPSDRGDSSVPHDFLRTQCSCCIDACGSMAPRDPGFHVKSKLNGAGLSCETHVSDESGSSRHPHLSRVRTRQAHGVN